MVVRLKKRSAHAYQLPAAQLERNFKLTWQMAEAMWDIPLQHLFDIATGFYRKGETAGLAEPSICDITVLGLETQVYMVYLQ